MTENVTELSRREKKLLMEIAKFEGERIKAILQTGGKAFVYRADGGLDFINWVVSEVKNFCTSGVVVLASGEGKKGGPIVIVGDEKSVEETVRKIKDVLHGVKGGGKGSRWQGKVIEWGKGDVEALKKIVGD